MPGVPKTCRLVSNTAVFEGDVPDFCRLGTLWGGRRQKASGKGEGVRRVGTVGRRKVRDEKRWWNRGKCGFAIIGENAYVYDVE